MRRAIKRTILLAAFLIGLHGLNAQQAAPEEIVHRASVWLHGNASLKSGTVPETILEFGPVLSPDVYVVTFRPGGFVILAGHEPGLPVLGWSDASVFPDDSLHPVRNWFIDSYVKSMAERAPAGTPLRAQNTGLDVTHDASRVTLKSSMSTDDAVLPMITAQWGQGQPWNQNCPADSTGKRALVGCVSVAMSQVMHYWKWPERGYGTVTYTPPQHPDYGEIRVNFEEARYDWEQMHPISPSDAAALLLYHAGVASYMNYGPSESATSVDTYAVPALRNHFMYQPGMIFRGFDQVPYLNWVDMLKQELINKRPVVYAGSSPDGKVAHAFNIDGFRGQDFFHFNWGWNGGGDGWYNLTTMGGGSANFSANQGAIFGMQPTNKPLHDRPCTLEVLPGDGFVQLFWEAPVMADFSHFVVYRDGQQVGIVADTEFRDTDLENGTAYQYEVTAAYGGQSVGESLPTPAILSRPWEAMEPGDWQAFEAGTQGWQLQGDVSGFMIGPAAELGFPGNAGKIAAIRSEGLPDGTRAADYLTSPVIFPSSYKHLAVSFDYVFRQNPDGDLFFLMYRDFLTGIWQPITRLDSTGGWSDWKNLHIYLPKPASNSPIQIAFYYNDFYGDAYGAAVDNIHIYEVDEPAIPAFTGDFRDLCQDQRTTYTDQSTGTIETWDWDFGEGAIPRYASTRGPHEVLYTEPGNKNVRLSLNHLDHLFEENYLVVRDQPFADFTFTRFNMNITFTSQARYANEILWIFGDGTTSSEQNPMHTYFTKERFEVRQIVYNGTCPPDTLMQIVDLKNGTGIDAEELDQALTIWPNPTAGKITLLFNMIPSEPLNISIMTITGKTILLQVSDSRQEIELDIFDFPEGLYILQIASRTSLVNRRIVKMGR